MLCFHSGKLVESGILVQPCTEGLELKDAPYEQPNKLVQVPINFSDLIGVDSESISLFADATTTTKQVSPSLLFTMHACLNAGTSLVRQLQDLGMTAPRSTHSYRAVQ